MKVNNNGKNPSHLTKIKLGAVAAILLASATLSGCSQDLPDSLTAAEIKSLMAEPNAAVYPVPDLKETVFEGVAKQFTVGTIKHLKSTRTSCFDAGGCFHWVPVQLEVEQSHPAISAGTVMIRLFPSSPSSPALDQLHVGDRVLAATSVGFIDDNKFDGYSLGWLFKIEADGTLTNLNPESKIKTDLKYVNDVLKTSFK